MVVLSFLAVVICYLDRVSIAVAVIPLQNEFGWSATRTGAVLSAFFIGYLIFQVPAGWAARRFGPRLLLGVALFWWSAMTIATPFAAEASFALLIATRILMGMGEASMFPGAYALFGAWVPRSEHSRAVGLLFSAIPLGTLLALVSSGWIAARFGWPWIFYVFGAIGLAFAILWLRVIQDSPTGGQASGAETSYGPSIEHDDLGAAAADTTRPEIPWRRLLSRAPVWALIFNSFCTSWSIYVLLSWTPLYLREVQGVSLASAGLLSALPWVTMFLMTNLAAWVADALIRRGVDLTLVRKMMQAGGLLGAASFLLAMPGAGSALIATLLLCGALGASALTMSGFAPNHLDLSPRFASVLIGVTNTAGTLPGVVGVFLTGWIVDTTQSYDAAFYVAAGVCLAGALVWLLFASARCIDEA